MKRSEATYPVMSYVSTRGARRSSGSPTCCLRGWRLTVACTCPSEWPELPDLDRGPRLRLDGGRRHGSVRRRRARPGCARSPLCATRTPTFRHPAVVPLVQIDDGSGCSSCSTARHSPSRTSPCSSSAGCSTACSRSAEIGSRSSAPRAATRGRRRSTASSTAPTSTS